MDTRAKKAQRPRIGGRSGGRKAIRLTETIVPQFPCCLQDAINLIDLALAEEDSAYSDYREAEAVAAARRRRYLKAVDNRRAIQNTIFSAGGQR
jgi:hypothetical protein